MLMIIIALVILTSYLHQHGNSLNGHGNRMESQQTPGSIHTPPNGGVNHFGGKASAISPNNLPYLTGPFVGRVEEMQTVTRNLLYSKNMVHIFGLPAVGKSTLAVHVGYKIATHRFAVRYINVDETHIFSLKWPHEDELWNSIKTEDHFQTSSDALSEIYGDITLPLYSDTEKKYISTSAQDLIEWAKGLSNDTLLILDNCDSLLVNRGKKFIELLDTLNKASPFLLIVTTSRLKITLLDRFKQYKLRPLNNQSSIELLQLLSDTITLNDRETINGLVDGIPLALKIVGSLVSDEQPPSRIITQLKQNLIGTLTPEDVRPEREKMRPVLQLSYKYLNTSNQECALFLSHFPGSFSHEAALQILGNNNFSSPNECLKLLSDRSLLDPYSYAGQLRYRFHKLIKEFLLSLESQNSNVETSRFAIEFKSSFLTHYTQELRKFVNRYNENPHDEENVGRFEYENHNLNYLLFKTIKFGDTCPVTALVDLARTLHSSLMLKIFINPELYVAGRKILEMFEDQMDDISADIGASETLNIYRKLIFGLRNRFPSDCSMCTFVCLLTFSHHSFTSRFQIIDKQLAKTDHIPYDYYRELKFLYYNPFSIPDCFSDCKPNSLSYSKTNSISLPTIILVLVVYFGAKHFVRGLTGRDFCYSILYHLCRFCAIVTIFDFLISIPVVCTIVLSFWVAVRVSSNVSKRIKHIFHLDLKALCFIYLCVLLITTFLITCIVLVICLLINAFLYSIDIGRYMLSFAFTFWYSAQYYLTYYTWLSIFYIYFCVYRND